LCYCGWTINNLAFVHHGIICFSIKLSAANATADTKPYSLGDMVERQTLPFDKQDLII